VGVLVAVGLLHPGICCRCFPSDRYSRYIRYRIVLVVQFCNACNACNARRGRRGLPAIPLPGVLKVGLLITPEDRHAFPYRLRLNAEPLSMLARTRSVSATPLPVSLHGDSSRLCRICRIVLVHILSPWPSNASLM